MYWRITSKNRKIHQHHINQYVRAINRNLAKDKKWQGRFSVRQVNSPTFFVYPDQSGASLYVTLEVIDHKTGNAVYKSKDVNEWCAGDGAALWWFVNDTIMAWREEYNF